MGASACYRRLIMRIPDRLGQTHACFSFEFFPPKTEEGVANLFTALEELRPLEPGFVSVTYGAGGSSRQLTLDLVKRLKRDSEVETMAHLTCVGASKDEIAATLDELAEAGIQNLLALRGDPPKGKAEFVKQAGLSRAAITSQAIISTH
mgnify:CR=1 FL=1